MSGILNQIGEKLSVFFKEGESCGFKTSDKNPFEKDVFADHLPYLSYDEESGVFINDGTLGFVIEAIPLVGSDESSHKEIQGIFEEILEEGANLQFLLWADHRTDPLLSRWEGGACAAGEIAQEISRKRKDHFKETKDFTCRIFRLIISYSIPNTKENSDILIKKLEEKKKGLLKTLQTMTYAFSWDANHLLKTLSGMICFSPKPEAINVQWNPLQPLSTQFSCGGRVLVDKDVLQWENNEKSQFKSFRVGTFPSYWSLNAMQLLIGDVVKEAYRINDPFFLHYGVHCPNQAHEDTKFWKKSQLIENQGKSGTLLRMIPNLASELQEADAIRRSVSKGSRFVWTQFSSGLWAPPERMSQSTQLMKSLFRMNEFILMENRFLHFPQFLSALPMTWALNSQGLKDLGVLKTTITPECSNFVPIQGEWIGTKSPGMLLVGRRGQILNWNPFDNKSGNYNISVVGRSGSGKSVFMQDLLLNGLRTGARVFVLEVGRSFEKLCDILDGQQTNFSQTSDICLNPFSNLPQDKEEREEGIAMIKSIIACMAAPIKGVGDYEMVMIEKAIRQAWDDKKNDASITDVAKWMTDQNDERAKTLGVMLNSYTKHGIYGKHFEGKNNVNFYNPFVLVELEELKEKKDLQSVVLQVFIMSITQQAFMGDRKTPFYICIDEAWDLLRGPQTGLFIETLARRLRKYNGSLVIGTQSVDDFFATPGAKAAFENSDWLCMLSQKKSSINLLAESGKLDLTESMKKAIESISVKHGEYSEVMIIDGDGHYSISRLMLDPFSILLYSTNANEYSRIKDFKNKGMTVSQAINQVLKERNKR